MNMELFQKDYKGKKIKDAYRKRIILQGLTGINEKFRLKATIIDPPAFLANSCNYLLDKNNMNFNFVLGLINSKLLNFIFKCKSTSSNVNGYEVDDLPFPKNIDETIEREIEKIVDNILEAKKKDPQANTGELENKIDQIVYKLYDLNSEEICIVENSIK